ncbi:hypothetical protein IMX07_12320 [bacterium]|nr:hypothetical protein [bacterium]
MRFKLAVAAMLAVGMAAGGGVAMARGAKRDGKISHGEWEGKWSDGDESGGYSAASVQGTYVLRFSGYINGTGTNPSAPVTGLAILNFDGAGNVTGTETTNTLLNSGSGAGVVCSGALAGTSSPNYTVNADGSGSATLQLTLSTGSDPACGTSPISNDFNFVIVSERRLEVSGSDNTGTWSGDALSQNGD